MATKKNFYDILGVARDASDRDIKKAFRKLSQKYHPDAPGGDEAKFKEISEAYTTLSNPDKRREYDQMLMFGMPGQGSGPHWQSTSNANWSDIFDSMFNGGGGFNVDFGSAGVGDMGSNPFGADPFSSHARRVPRKGKNLTLTLELSAKDALSGVEKKVTYRIPSNGQTASVTVHVPAGAVDGGKLRYKHRGDFGQDGAERGDLIIITSVAEDPVFKRHGADIHMQLPISMFEAALGCNVDVPTPLGKTVRLRVPAGTQSGKKFRFKQMGAPDVQHKGRTGALLVEIKVMVPTHLSDSEKTALTQLKSLDTRNYRKDIDSIAEERI